MEGFLFTITALTIFFSPYILLIVGYYKKKNAQDEFELAEAKNIIRTGLIILLVKIIILILLGGACIYIMNLK